MPAGKVVSLIAADAGVPEGRHGVVFSTETQVRSSSNGPSPARPATTVATTVVHGSRRPVFASPRWSMAIGTDLAVDNVLVVLNADGSDGTVTVKTLGAGGEVPVPGMESDRPAGERRRSRSASPTRLRSATR